MMNKKFLTLAVIAAISLGANSYAQVPEKQTQNMYSESVNELTYKAVQGNLAANMEQAETLKLDINEAAKTAINSNFKVRASKEAYEEASAKLGKAYSARNPKLNYGYKFTRGGGETEVENPQTGKMDMKGDITNKAGHSLSISMPLYTGGMIDGSVKAAKYATEIANAQVKQAEAEAKVEAAKAYFGVLKANNMKDVASQAVTDLTKHLKNVNLQYEVGVVAKSDVLATEVAVANANTNLIKANNAVDLSETALNYALSLSSNTNVEITDKTFNELQYGITLQEATAYALTHRPEVIQSVLAVEVMKAQVEMARAGYKPKIEIGASKTWGHVMPTPKTPADLAAAGYSVTGRAEDWSAYIGATWNLWDGGTSSNNVKEAKASLEAQELKTKDAIEAITMQVKQAYLNLNESMATINSTKVAVEKAQESFRIASLRYKAGVGINLDVLDAELNLNKARNEYVSALYNYNVNVAVLERMIGVPADLQIGVGLENIHTDTAIMN